MKAAGVGITLTAATRVIFLELSFAPGLLLQAEDRVHRVGQTAPVTVTYLLSPGSADDWIWPMVTHKLKITGAAMDGRAASMHCGEDVARGGGGGGHRVDKEDFGAYTGFDEDNVADSEDVPLWQAEKQYVAGAAAAAGPSPMKRKLPFAEPSPLPPKLPKLPVREMPDGAIDLTGDSQLLEDEWKTLRRQPRVMPLSRSDGVRRQSGAAGDAIEID